ncbi:hypothetical protein Btru_005591 [Bulinus truncatus]|nr:hypothetical protein Btru_005591 [Bulinus truncatus]
MLQNYAPSALQIMFQNYVPELCSRIIFQNYVPNYVPELYFRNYVPGNQTDNDPQATKKPPSSKTPKVTKIPKVTKKPGKKRKLRQNLQKVQPPVRLNTTMSLKCKAESGKRCHMWTGIKMGNL